ncbi:AAA family ATPase [Arthrobacter sp. HLT1-20]
MNVVSVVAVGDTAAGVIEQLAGRRGKLSIVRRCPELAQLLAACQSGLAQVAVVAQGADELTATLVDRLTAVGVSVVAVADTPEDARRLHSMGAAVVSGSVTAEALSAAVLAAVEGTRHHFSTGFAVPASHDQQGGSPDLPPTGGAAAVAGLDGAGGQTASTVPGPEMEGLTPSGAAVTSPESERTPASSGVSPPPDADGVDAQGADNQGADQHGTPAGVSRHMPAGLGAKVRAVLHRDRRPGRLSRSIQKAGAPPTGTGTGPSPPAGEGTLVAVWGPVGSPGRTTVAVNLAAEQAAAGRSVMLIDADSFGASVAAALGLLDESASFAQACRAADQGQLGGAQLAKIATQVVFSGGSFSLLTGLTRPDRWPELRAAAVQRVLSRAQEMVDLVIVDCGFSLESDEELSYDTVAPRRNAATLMVLGQADIIYALGNADAVGIPRLIRGLAELARQCPAADVRVVVNKVRRRAVGGAPERALAQAWDRFGPSLAISHFLPWEPELTDKALLEGRLLQEIAPDAPLRKAIRGISCAAVQQNPESAVRNATAKREVRR